MTDRAGVAGGTTILPMFPLGTVLLPTMLLPLHVFEPRYRTLLRDIGPEGRFGIVMIERGSEVGGGDVRAAVACAARLVAAEELADGRWHVAVVGEERLAVRRWLTDDPYPRAEVEVLDEPPAVDPGEPAWTDLDLGFRSILERLAGPGTPSGAVALAADPALATYQMAALGPFEVLDRYRVLAAATPEARRAILEDAVEGVRAVLDAGA